MTLEEAPREEFGLVGNVVLITLYLLIILGAFIILFIYRLIMRRR